MLMEEREERKEGFMICCAVVTSLQLRRIHDASKDEAKSVT